MALEAVQTAVLSSNSATKQEELGTRVNVGGKTYKYIQFTAGVPTPAIGDAVGYVATTGYGANMVSGDVSTTDGVLAGVLVAALTDQYYGWIQIKGPCTTFSTSFVSGSAGNAMTLSSTTDSTLKVCAAATDPQCAIMVAAKSAILDCPT